MVAKQGARLALAATLLLASSGGGAPALANPHTVHKPTDIWEYYPDRAYRYGIQGEALISCGVDDQARLRNCTVLDVQPANQGFEDAALRLAKEDIINPPLGTAAETEGYHVMLTFCLEPVRGIYPTFPPSGPKPPCLK